MEKFRLRAKLPKFYCGLNELKEPLAKIVFYHPDEKMISFTKELLDAHPRADEFDFIRSERTLYEILPKGVGH